MSQQPFAASAAVLDRAAPMPLWYQLREALLRQIRDRAMKTGDRLPTESEIERTYGVSRATIRQALAELEAWLESRSPLEVVQSTR